MDIAGAILALAPSGLFDAAWYRAEHEGAAALRGDPLVDFCDAGWRELRRPNRDFDTAWYLSQNADVAGSGINPLLHYLQYGEDENRWPAADFDPAWHRSMYGLAAGESCLAHHLVEQRGQAPAAGSPDEAEVRAIQRSGLFAPRHYRARYGVRGTGLALIEHFCRTGWRQGYNPNQVFDTACYLEWNTDVRDSGVNPLLHYITDGAAEARGVSRRFDAVQYRAAYGVSDAALPMAACSAAAERRAALLDWLQRPQSGNECHSGLFARTVDAVAESKLFDANFYLIHYPDVRLDGIAPVEHFCRCGEREGRRPNPYFDPAWYRAQYAVPEGWAGNTLLHYILLGEAAGNRPIAYFDPGWYARRYGIAAVTSPLLHYLQNRRQQVLSPTELFDAECYARQFAAVAGPNRDLFAHYLRVGIAEDIDPGPCFDSARYRRQRMEPVREPFHAAPGAEIVERIRREALNPLVHHLLHEASAA